MSTLFRDFFVYATTTYVSSQKWDEPHANFPFDSVTWTILLTSNIAIGGEPAGKPGSVVGNHSSTDCVTAALEQPTRKHAGPTLQQDLAIPCDFPIWPCSRWGLPCRRLLPATRCALTAPFHPCQHALLRTSAVCFLLHFPWARAPQGLPGTLSSGARTFLPGAPCDAPQRLPGRLPRAHITTLSLWSIQTEGRSPCSAIA